MNLDAADCTALHEARTLLRLVRLGRMSADNVRQLVKVSHDEEYRLRGRFQIGVVLRALEYRKSVLEMFEKMLLKTETKCPGISDRELEKTGKRPQMSRIVMPETKVRIAAETQKSFAINEQKSPG